MVTSTPDKWLRAHFSAQFQFYWLKISFQKMGCQKINSTDVEEKKFKSQYIIQQWFEKVFIEVQLQSLCRANTKWAKENTSSSYVYVSSIDQGAMRLGGQ